MANMAGRNRFLAKWLFWTYQSDASFEARGLPASGTKLGQGGSGSLGLQQQGRPGETLYELPIQNQNVLFVVKSLDTYLWAFQKNTKVKSKV